MATLTTLFSFDGGDGTGPEGSLLADASGDLFGTTARGGADNDGTVFELAFNFGTAAFSTTSFTGADGDAPVGGLIADANGDLFGDTEGGGSSNDGTVFEVAKTAAGYATAPTVLASFSGTDGMLPLGSLLAGPDGNLFGTAELGGASSFGTVFKVVPGFGGSILPTISFNGADGSFPAGTLAADASGDLLGTTFAGGANNDGTVFEIAKTATGYASAPVVLASFDGSDGINPESGLIADADGDLFGTADKGTGNDGTVYEIVKAPDGVYASVPTVLAGFDSADGANPSAGLIADAAGDLFGTTAMGGEYNLGTVFELAKTASGYASQPTVLVSFDGADGSAPIGGLIADASGDLFGTASKDGPGNNGTIFEITDSGYQVACYCRGTRIMTDHGDLPLEALAIGDRVITLSGAAEPIRWIGRRAYAGRFLAGRRELLPVLIRAGALGGGLPRRDLRVSPLHAMYLDGALIPAHLLLNGTTIVRDTSCQTVDYFHIELAEHGVIWAEGAASETFLDDDSRGQFHNAAEYAALYSEADRPSTSFAPRVEQGDALQAIRRRIADIARRAA